MLQNYDLYLLMIDKKTLYKIAKSSKIRIDVEEEPVFLEGMNKIVSFIDKLNEINVDNVPDFNHVNDFNNNLREDQEEKFKNINSIKNNALNFRDNYFIVPDNIIKERE
ncbi:MAG: Asp-tRNA(Asn)/Glu-tRNA(Gln) amidotransferase subunit GatC [Thiohalospira sp.]